MSADTKQSIQTLQAGLLDLQGEWEETADQIALLSPDAPQLELVVPETQPFLARIHELDAQATKLAKELPPLDASRRQIYLTSARPS